MRFRIALIVASAVLLTWRPASAQQALDLDSLIEAMRRVRERRERSVMVLHYENREEGSELPLFRTKTTLLRYGEKFHVTQEMFFPTKPRPTHEILVAHDGQTYRHHQLIGGVDSVGAVHREYARAKPAKREYRAANPSGGIGEWLNFIMPGDSRPIYELLLGQEELVEISTVDGPDGPVIVLKADLEQGRYEFGLDPARDYNLAFARYEKVKEEGHFIWVNSDNYEPIEKYSGEIRDIEWELVLDTWSVSTGANYQHVEYSDQVGGGSRKFVRRFHAEAVEWLDSEPAAEKFTIEWPVGTVVVDETLSLEEPIRYVVSMAGTLVPDNLDMVEEVLRGNLARALEAAESADQKTEDETPPATGDSADGVAARASLSDSSTIAASVFGGLIFLAAVAFGLWRLRNRRAT